MDRAEWLYEYWLEQSTLFTDSEKLGNVAAIHRWETATMGRSLERVIPPSVLASAHERVLDALEMASRAAQLLSNGSRFHNANAVCEGHAMLAVSRERRLAALQSMRRYLSRIHPVVDPGTDAASSEMLAEAAALVALGGDAPASDQPATDPSAASSAPDGATADVPSADPEHPGAAGDADPESPWPAWADLDPESPWPEHPEHDLILTDASEPEPAWLSAARAHVTAEVPADAPPSEPPAAPAAPAGSTSPSAVERADTASPVEAPGDTPVEDPIVKPGDAPAPDPPVPDVAAPERSARTGRRPWRCARAGWLG